jgi:LPS export ABC transporter protein LptC
MTRRMDIRIVLGGWLTAACCIGCTKLDTPAPATMRSEMPQQELYNSTITFYQNDKLSSVLKAGRIRKFERNATVFLDSGVVADFFSEQGKHTSTLWADSARTDEIRKDMTAMGHVIAKSDSGETLETNLLRWENRTRKIRSEANVKLSTRTDTIYGIGFVSDEHLRNWTIEKPQGRTFRELEKRLPRDTLSSAKDTLP